MLDFDLNREPPSPRDAASVVVLRERGGALEVFCVERHVRSGFLAGAVVFPGGKLDPSDGAETWRRFARDPLPRAERFASPSASARALAVAACRETLEEGGIVPLDRGADASEAAGIRRALERERHQADGASESAALAHVLERLGRRLDLGALVPWARWVTPEAESRRFDARFFLLALPLGQEGAADQRETTQSFWARPSEVLARSARREIFLAPPTTRTLELLSSVARFDEAVALAEGQSLLPICPRFVADPTAPFLALPGDPAHEVREKRVAGPSRFVLRDGRFVAEEAP